jgi:hypothetical protein
MFFWSENGTFEPKICFIMFYLCLFHIILLGNMMIILVGTIWYHNVQSQMVWCHLEIIHIMRTGTALGPEYGYNVMTFLSCVVSSICQARVVIDCLMTLVILILLCKAAIPATIQCINAKNTTQVFGRKLRCHWHHLWRLKMIWSHNWHVFFRPNLWGIIWVDVPCIARTAQAPFFLPGQPPRHPKLNRCAKVLVFVVDFWRRPNLSGWVFENPLR